MRDFENGYSAWRDLEYYTDNLRVAIDEKDEEGCGVAIINLLWIICNEHNHPRVVCAGDGEFLFNSEEKADALADVFELALNDRCGCTGYYDPEDDKREGCVDEFTGKWWASWE